MAKSTSQELIWGVLSVLPQAFVTNAQDSIEQVRNSYNFVQAGLSTLAAGASVALCLARGRLDSEMGMADFFTTTRFTSQSGNSHGAVISLPGDHGSIIGVHILQPNPNAIGWIGHNTWVLGSTTTLVPFWKSYKNVSPAGTPAQATCICWHIPSVSVLGGRQPAMDDPDRIAGDIQCYRFRCYQCDVHGKDKMPALHSQINPQQALTAMILEGPSQLYQWMLEDEQQGRQCMYLFAMDVTGVATLKRMVAESLATLDSSQKGRTSDLVEWSLNKLQLEEKPDMKWVGTAAAVVLVGAVELVLLLLLSVVFGLDPFVSALGARRGVRSLRLGSNGVTQFGDLWLLRVEALEIKHWKTPILRVVPRTDLTLFYFDCALKIIGLTVASVYWALTVFGYVHPLGLEKASAWGDAGKWTLYVVLVGNVVGFVTSGLPLRLQNTLPGHPRLPGYSMVGYSILYCFVEVAITSWRFVPQFWSRTILMKFWYVVLEFGIWLQWCAGKRSIPYGPQSGSGIAWELTLVQAGALARAAVLAAVSGKWKK